MVSTDRFAELARQSGQQAGLENARVAALPHPVGGVAKDELGRRADEATEDVMNLLLGR